MCEVYGAIKLKQVKEILKTFYPNMDDDQFTSYILLCLTLIRVSSNTKDMEKKKLKHGTTEYWMDWKVEQIY